MSREQTVEAPTGAATMADLQGRMKGTVLHPGDADYDAARRVWNGMIDRRPTLIARCDGVMDVLEAVRYARDAHLPVAVRGGGHNVAGSAVCDGGLVVDMSGMRQVHVDPAIRTARVQAGALWSDVDRETQAFSLAVPGGKVSHTGVAGLTLSGGAGWLRRRYGMSCDSLRSIDLVTADGEHITADRNRHPDLFWALRGGGGNFGVVTSFEFDCHPVGPEIYFLFCGYTPDKGTKVVEAFRNFTAQAPDEVAMLCVCLTYPDDPAFPVAEARGQKAIALLAMHIGAPEEGERLLAPLRKVDEPLADLSGPTTYATAQSMLDPSYPHGRNYYWKAVHLGEAGVSDQAMQVFLDQGFRRPSDLSGLVLWQMGGAIDRVGMDEAAFPGRNASFLLAAEAAWDDPGQSEANIDWVRQTIDRMEPFAKGGLYLNFPGFLEDNDAMVEQAFGQHLARLARVKADYDPINMFCFNQNIRPQV